MYGMVTSHATTTTSNRSSIHRSTASRYHHYHHEQQQHSSSNRGQIRFASNSLQAQQQSQGNNNCHARRTNVGKSRSVYRRVVNLFKQAWTGVKIDDSSMYDGEMEECSRQKPQGIKALCRLTKFNREELQLLYRGFKQACPSGTVTEETLRDVYAKFFPQGDTSRYAHYVFNSFDHDQSGEITFEEFAFGLSTLLRGSMHDKISWTFDLYDIDHDGFITKEEMLNVVSSIYCLLGKEIEPQVDENTAKLHVEKVFEKLDLNKDGVVTLEEFVEVCTKDEAIHRAMCMFDTI